MRRVVPALLAAAAMLAPAPVLAAAAAEPSDQVVLSGDVVVPRGTTAGEIVVFHGTATVRGVAAGDVVVLDGPIVVGGQVRGSVVALDGDVRLLATAQVAGDVLASGTVSEDRGATVEGEVREGFSVSLSKRAAELGALLAPSAIAVSVLVAGLLLLLLAPRGAERAAAAARSAPFASAGWGLALTIVVPAGVAIAAASVLALPLALAVLLALGLLWLFGLTMFAWVVGRALVQPPRRAILGLLAGWALVGAIGLVPILGPVAWGLGSMFGAGVTAVATWRARGTARHRIGATADVGEGS
jgi:hypothetical protein